MYEHCGLSHIYILPWEFLSSRIFDQLRFFCLVCSITRSISSSIVISLFLEYPSLFSNAATFNSSYFLYWRFLKSCKSPVSFFSILNLLSLHTVVHKKIVTRPQKNCHSSTKKLSLVHENIVTRPRKYCHSSTKKLSLVHENIVTRPRKYCHWILNKIIYLNLS